MIWDKCKHCQGTNNCPGEGGTERCFHCGDCGAIQCYDESPEVTGKKKTSKLGR